MTPGRGAALVAVLALAGCFTYVPAELATLPLGESVRVHLARAAPDSPGAVSADGAPLRGTLVRREGERVFIRVPVASRQEGFSVIPIAQEVGVAARDVLRVERRRRSGTRTALLVAGTGAVAAYVIAMIVGDHSDRPVPDVEPPDEARVPLPSIPLP